MYDRKVCTKCARPIPMVVLDAPYLLAVATGRASLFCDCANARRKVSDDNEEVSDDNKEGRS